MEEKEEEEEGVMLKHLQGYLGSYKEQKFCHAPRVCVHNDDVFN